MGLEPVRHSSLVRKVRERLGSAAHAGASGADPQAKTPDVPQRLAAAGLVDREFYETLTGLSFDTDLDAATHLVREGIDLGLTCHPLLEPASFPTWLQGHWAEGRAFRVITASKRANVTSTSPLFHVPTYLAAHPESADHPGGPLGHFSEHAADDSVLPTGPLFLAPAPTWGQARAVLLERAAEYRRQADLLGQRYWPSFDEAGHAPWVEKWSTAPLPRFEGQPTVSIVIPVKNRPGQVVEAIESIQAQTLEDWELIVVDDGSTDTTPEVLRDHAARDPRIHVIEMERSQGAGVARNAGIDAATGHYLAFLDSDNTWEPNFLRVSVAVLHGEGHRFVYAAAQVSSTGDRKFLAYDGGADDLMIQNHITMITFVAETELVRESGRFDPRLRRWIDFDMIIRMARLSPPTFLPFVGARYDNIEGTDDRITRMESGNWQFVAFGKNLVDWDRLASSVAERVPGRVSVLLHTYQDHKMTRAAVNAVLETTVEEDVEVVVVDNGSTREVTALLAASFVGEPRVRVLRLPRHYGIAAGTNVAFGASTGAHIVFLASDTVARPGWLRPLLQRLEDEQVLGVQPLVLSLGDSVQSAGYVFLAANGIATPYLRDHPVEDARRDDGRGLHALSGTALVMRSADVAALRGFDCMFVNGMEDVDLCLRAARLRPGTFEVVRESEVTHLDEAPVGRNHTAENRRVFLNKWRGQLPSPQGRRYLDVGLAVTHLASSDSAIPTPHPVLVRAPRPAAGDGMPGAPCLRWGINIGSPGGAAGESWGDTHFAGSLAHSLRELGQEVVVQRRGAHHLPTAYLNDVTVTVRGLSRVHPRPGILNILWVISHPDQVTADEVRDFDLVFAASSLWAAQMSTKAGVPVGVLHQATDPRLFHPTSASEDRSGVLFVGNARRYTGRQVVTDALSGGVDLAVYGSNWEGRLPEGVLQGRFLDNHQLVDFYSSASVVLNDHWEDMAKHGFVNNRLFDAVASGACVVSDYVAGIDELFHGMVQTYRTVDELARLCGEQGRAAFPDLEVRRKIADTVRREHSFDKRAEELLTAALEHRGRLRDDGVPPGWPTDPAAAGAASSRPS